MQKPNRTLLTYFNSICEIGENPPLQSYIYFGTLALKLQRTKEENFVFFPDPKLLQNFYNSLRSKGGIEACFEFKP